MARWVLIAAACLALIVVTGCDRSSPGNPVSASEPARTTSTTAAPSPTSTSSLAPEPGVVTTARAPIPPNASVCTPSDNGEGRARHAEIADPAAPRITIHIPEHWTAVRGTGDQGLVLSGPDGMSGLVTIATTTLDPAAAFRKYADSVMATAPISTLSMLPAEFCGYSSQRMNGVLADRPGQSVEYTDRVTHIWTNTKDYLVVIHLQAPAKADGFDDAETMVTNDFSVVIP